MNRWWPLFLACASACGQGTAPTTDDASESVATDEAPSPALPNGLHPRATAAVSSGSCAQCHAEIATEWRASFHRASTANAWYRAAFASEPRAFCKTCHTPFEALADEGITCVGCHETPHGEGPRLTTSSACAGCHEFPYQTHADGESAPPLMQSTVAEAAGHAPECQTCHMPLVGAGSGRHRSHRFDAAAMLGRSLGIEATAHRVGDEIEITLTLTSKSGHAVPTGDLFRTLVIEARTDGAAAHATLARTFRFVPGEGQFVRRDGPDLRVFPGAPRVVRLRLRGAANEVQWSVAHQRTSNAVAAQDGVDVGRTQIAHGVVSVTKEKSP